MTSWLSSLNVPGLQTAVPAAIAVLSAIIGFFKINGRAGRMQTKIKDTLELAKLAKEIDSDTAKEKLDELAAQQVDALRMAERRNETRERDTSSLVAVIVLLAVGIPLAWALFLPQWLLTDILAWVVIVFLAVFVPVGAVQFFTGPPRSSTARSRRGGTRGQNRGEDESAT